MKCDSNWVWRCLYLTCWLEMPRWSRSRRHHTLYQFYWTDSIPFLCWKRGKIKYIYWNEKRWRSSAWIFRYFCLVISFRFGTRPENKNFLPIFPIFFPVVTSLPRCQFSWLFCRLFYGELDLRGTRQIKYAREDINHRVLSPCWGSCSGVLE